MSERINGISVSKISIMNYSDIDKLKCNACSRENSSRYEYSFGVKRIFLCENCNKKLKELLENE